MLWVGRIGTVAVLLLMATQASAGVLAGDANAMGGPLQGNKVLTEPITDPVDVEYAVYAPGQFNLSFPGADPTGGTEYVFAYQLCGRADGFMFWDDLLGLSVGIMDESAPFSAPGLPVGNVGFVELDPTASPSNMWVDRLANGVATSVRWEYTPFSLMRGICGDVLYYTSPQGPAPVPDWDNSNVGTLMGAVQYETLPHPVPEPTTLLLLAVGAGALRRRKRRTMGVR